jgi:hypothetical protein
MARVVIPDLIRDRRRHVRGSLSGGACIAGITVVRSKTGVVYPIVLGGSLASNYRGS